MKTRVQDLVLIAGVLTGLTSPLFAQAGELPDKEAKAAIAEFKTTMKANPKSLAKRLAAVQKLATSKNGLLVKPLLKTVRSDKSKAVRQAAVVAIGNQPKKKARPALISLLKKTRVESNPDLVAKAVLALGVASYESRDWSLLQGIFNKCLTNKNAIQAQTAIIDLAGTNKEIDATNFLTEHIDGPAPAWVDDPGNPPASYWEARWKNWAKWKGNVKESLFKITGQRFGTKKEAKLWLKKNGKKLKRTKPGKKKKK